MGVLPYSLTFRRTTLLMVLCGAFLGGVVVARRVHMADWAVLLWAVTMVAVSLRKRRLWALLCVILLGVFAGMWRGGQYMQTVRQYEVFMKRPVVLTAVALSDAVYDERSQLSFEVSDIRIEDPEEVELAGKIRVSGFGVPMVYKGDVLQIEAKLFPARGSAQAQMSFAQLAKVGERTTVIDSLRREFVAGLQSVLPEPQASFGAGLLIGQRSTLPKDTSDQLSATGLTHLVAVSGYNLTILIDAVRRMLGKWSKFQSTVLSLMLMGAFVLMTGLSASIVRAAMVSTLTVGAWYYGRTIRPVLLLLLVAALTAWWNPFYVWSDIGWYLSFLAFFGVLAVAPLLTRRLSPTGKTNSVAAILLECIAAQIMTLPIIMYIFGRVSLVGLIANVLVVPMVPVAMFAVLLAGLSGMLMPMVGGWIAWPAQTLLVYVLDVVSVLSRLPRAVVEQVISAWQMATMYGCILLVSVVLWHKNRAKNGIITDDEGVL